MERLPSGLDWDAGNVTKCQNGVTVEEIVDLFATDPRFSPDAAHSINEQRFIAVGRTQIGRALFVSFTLRERDGELLVRPISARYMHAKEVSEWEREKYQ